jgi:hypothetical protein
MDSIAIVVGLVTFARKASAGMMLLVAVVVAMVAVLELGGGRRGQAIVEVGVRSSARHGAGGSCVVSQSVGLHRDKRKGKKKKMGDGDGDGDGDGETGKKKKKKKLNQAS